MTLPAFIAWEAVQTANDGGLVVILAKHPQEVLTDLLNNGGQELAKTIFRANGNERIDFDSHGQIRVVRRSEEFSRYTANLAIVPIGLSNEDRLNILPTLAASTDIVGYY